MTKTQGLLATASSLLLTACAGLAGVLGAHVNAYDGSERPIEQLAVLLNSGVAMPARVDGRHVGDDILGYPSDVRVLPGEHKIRLDCMEGNFKFKPTEITGRFEAGHFYRFSCHEQAGGQYAADLTDLGTQDPRKQSR